MTDEDPRATDPIRGVRPEAGMTVGDLLEQYDRAGFGAGDLHRAAAVATRIFAEDVTAFLGLAGAMVPAGMGPLVADLIRDGHVDVLVTTGATLTHDTIEAIGGDHHHGEPGGREHDERLREAGIDRIHDVYLPQEHFATFETHLREAVLPGLADRGPVSIAELTRALGEANREAATDDPGIAAAAAANDVPIYCPAVADSILGLQAWMYGQTSDLQLDALADTTAISDRAFEAETAGAFVVGGGVPKNFVLQTMLVTPDAYEYALQLTMDPPRTGGLSGATLDEARSWGKLEPGAENVSVYGDATVTLPLVVAAAREALE